MISQEELKKTLNQFYDYAAKKLKIKRQPQVVFREDEKNAEDIFGKTAYYDGEEEKIVLYITGRHAKDILRSFSHELVHHSQKEQKKITLKQLSGTTEVGYALENKKLRQMEVDAFKRGNMIFRDFTDLVRTGKITLSENVNREFKSNLNEGKNMDNKLLIERVVKRVAERLKKLTEKKAAKDYDGDGKVESGSEEYLGSKDKAIKAAKAGKSKKETMSEKAKKHVKNVVSDRTSGPEEAKERTMKSGKSKVDEGKTLAEREVEHNKELLESLLKKFNIIKG